MTRDAIMQTIRDAFIGAGLDPDDERLQAVAGNVAQVWLLEQQWQERREALVGQLVLLIKGLDEVPFNPIALPTGVFHVVAQARAAVTEIITLDEIDATGGDT